MECIGIIPARYESTRFRGKVLAELCGKPIIQHVYENVSEAKYLSGVIVATDNMKIKNKVESFNGNVVMTSSNPCSGTERVIEALGKLSQKIDVVVNVQADEPLVKASMIDKVAKSLLEHETFSISTLKKRIENIKELYNPNVVKVVVDKNDFALYFSRSIIPFSYEKKPEYHFKHIGIYGYRKKFLMSLSNYPDLNLSSIEKLEQLQILENSFKIKVLSTEYDTVGVDTEEDLKKVRGLLNGKKYS